MAGRYKFARGDQTMVISLEKGALVAWPRGHEDKKERLRSQGDGTYLQPEWKAKVTFEMKDGRADAVIANADAARLRGARITE